MNRKRLTQYFPFLLPLRIKQKKFCYYLKMRFDKNRYAASISDEKLPYLLFEAASPLMNLHTGFDLKYQINKVHNLKLAAATVNQIVIRPGETFSFWHCARRADRYESYKDGLCLVNGKLKPISGGGLCQLSNLLLWLFLHSPLTITERHGHSVKDFPGQDAEIPEGVDATIREGWLDLKVKNNTDTAFQIVLAFDEANLYGTLRAEKKPSLRYSVSAKDLHYIRKNGKIFEKVSIYRQQWNIKTGRPEWETLMYTHTCEIGYTLPEGTPIEA